MLLVGATNLPWSLDEAVLRRLVKRIYIPLPDEESRHSLISNMMTKHGKGGKGVKENDRMMQEIVRATSGYSGSDLTALCKEAAMGPIRDIPKKQIMTYKVEDVRAVQLQVRVVCLV